MTKTARVFRHDQWLQLTPDAMEPGDILNHNGQSVVVSGKPTLVDGAWHVPAALQEPGPIQVDLSNGFLAQAMDYAGTALQVFADGTAILAELEFAPGFVYSPRLPKAELAAFCRTHLHRYEAFFDANQEAILNGDSVAMEPWWRTTDSTATEVIH